MVKHETFLNACERYLEEKGETNIKDMLVGLKTKRGFEMNTRQIPTLKGAKARLTRDSRFKRIEYGGRVTCFALRRKG